MIIHVDVRNLRGAGWKVLNLLKTHILDAERCWKALELGSKGGYQHLKHLVNMYGDDVFVCVSFSLRV